MGWVLGDEALRDLLQRYLISHSKKKMFDRPRRESFGHGLNRFAVAGISHPPHPEVRICLSGSPEPNVSEPVIVFFGH